MTTEQGLKKLFNQFKFIAKQPLKINAALFVDLVLVFISFFELDAVVNGVLKDFFIFCLVINVGLVIGSFLYIANLPEKPSSLYDIKFEYRRSLNSTREIQKLLMQNVDSSNFPTARKQGQINNNLVRYGSFVICFERYAYIFVRLPQKVDSRRGQEIFDEIANEVSLSLGMRRTNFQHLIMEESFGFGQIKLKDFLVMRIIK